MGISLAHTLCAMGWMLLCGVLLGAIYDLVRVSRVMLRLCGDGDASARASKSVFLWMKRKLHCPWWHIRLPFSSFWIALGDLFFAISAACCFAVTLAFAGSGIFRWFYLFCAGVGFFAYHQSIGRMVMFLSRWMVDWLGVLSLSVFWLATRPIVLCGKVFRRLFCTVCKHIWHPIHKRYQRTRMRHYTERVRRALIYDVQLQNERSD